MLDLAATALVIAHLSTAAAGGTTNPVPEPAVLFDGLDADPGITPPEDILGWPLGDRPAAAEAIERCLVTWAAESDRATLVRYGETHEGRGLWTLFISSERNLEQLDRIQRDWRTLWDARTLEPEDAEALLERTPAVAWFAYAIHGSELSGADAALAFAYELVASSDRDAAIDLDRVVIAIDPLMNPDGRSRAIQAIREARGPVPTFDDQTRLHAGRWPSGRGNHYLLDLNRDWILGTAPETRARLAFVGGWNPLLFIDAHEMGAQDTYLFSPPREPINAHIPEFTLTWGERFAADQAAAFDRRGWAYYTGEWLDNWYPGYSDAWASYRGAIGILYEQSRARTFGVRHATGRITTYRQSVLHQLESSRANLRTLLASLDEVKPAWLASRRAIVEEGGRYDDRTYAFPPTPNAARQDRLLENLLLQGIEVHRATDAFEANATDALGREHDDRAFPAGTLLVHTRQPTGPLISAMLELDPRMTPAFIAKERRALIQRGETEIYDVTGWSLPLLLGLEAFRLDQDLPAATEPVTETASSTATIGILPGDPGQGWVVDGADDRTPALAAHLMQRGVRVRFADKDFVWDGQPFARGSLLIAGHDQVGTDTATILDECARATGLAARPVATGFGPGEIIDIGGEHFDLLVPPRIAVIGDGRVDSSAFGSIWHTLEERYGIAASFVPSGGALDWRRYNVVVLPPGAAAGISNDEAEAWIENGGTLVAVGSSAFALAREGGLGSARRLRDVLADLDAYELDVLRSLAATDDDPDAAWGRVVDRTPPRYPWDGIDLERPATAELERRDAWERQFMPVGTVLAARTDDEHWLTAGSPGALPLLTAGRSVLMAAGRVESPIRYGVVEEGDGDEAESVGWSRMPGGLDLRLRMSGLLWPEAARRLANAPAVTREGIGSGQLILFANDPTWRGATAGAERVFMNAVIHGPGLGASAPILP